MTTARTPTDMTGTRPRAERTAIRFPAVLRTVGGGFSHAAEVLNVSISGALLALDDTAPPPPRNRILTLTMRALLADRPVFVRVARVTGTAEQPEIGVSFLDLPDDARPRIRRLVERRVAVEGYAVQRLLAQGGHGEVYLCRATRPDVEPASVVVKRIHAEDSADARLLEQFRAEVDVLGQLRHESVVRLVGSQLDPVGCHLVLEHVDGCRCST